MGWSAQYLGQPPVVEAVYSGRVSPRDLQEAFAAVGALLVQHQCLRVLADCSGATTVPPLTKIFQLVLTLAGAGIPPSFREALLLPGGEQARPDVVFFETACRNRGLNMRVFASREDALGWLTDAGVA